MSESIREFVSFPGARGVLGGELAYPADREPQFAALLAGPHPYMGGTMNNSLLAALADELTAVGGAVLRFDYGGTGRSEGPPIDVAASMSQFWATGHAPEDPERVADCRCAFEYVLRLGVHPVALVGYSFGAKAIWELAGERAEIVAAVAVLSPTLARHAFTWPINDAEFPPLLVINSADDFATPSARVQEWVACAPRAVSHACFPVGNHFFRGSEVQPARRAAEFVRLHATRVGEYAGAAPC